MVSFSCSQCGDIVTKKKLDSHCNRCRGASFTCLDCMVDFHGTDYRLHTSCMTEDQKYQGALYREKPNKANKRKSVSIVEPGDHNALVPHKAYVEDAPDVDTGAPPPVPSPPPAAAAQNTEAVNVFDFLVEGDTPEAPRTSARGPNEQMSLNKYAPKVLTESNGDRPSRSDRRKSKEQPDDRHYEERGYSYGEEPIEPGSYTAANGSLLSLEYMTPAAKATRAQLEEMRRPGHSRTDSGNTSEKKRKRAETDLEADAMMIDVPTSNIENPGLAHSGLTGGLNRMMSNDEGYFGSQPRQSEREPSRSTRRSKAADPPSPLKRSRHSKDDAGLGISIKGRAGKVMSMVGEAFAPGALKSAQNGNRKGDLALVRTRRDSSSQEGSQPRNNRDNGNQRKKHKVHSHPHGSRSARHEKSNRRDHGTAESPRSGQQRAIEYHRDSHSDSDSEHQHGHSQMVVFGRVESFLSVVTKGPDSTQGYSFNKALKRWHRDREIPARSKADEEKELWRSLRLKRNERGEVVVFF